MFLSIILNNAIKIEVFKMRAYHSTTKKAATIILNYGLLPGKNGGFTEDGSWADNIYGIRPIYVSLEPGKFEGEIILEIDVTDIKIYPDFPSLVHEGAYIEDDFMWFSEDDEPPLLKPFLNNDGEIYFYDILHSDGIMLAIITLTGTACILDPVPPEKISVF